LTGLVKKPRNKGTLIAPVVSFADNRTALAAGKAVVTKFITGGFSDENHN
jgi:hypothetical protein